MKANKISSPNDLRMKAVDFDRIMRKALQARIPIEKEKPSSFQRKTAKKRTTKK